MARTTALGWGSGGTNALEPDYFERQAERWPGKRSSTFTEKPKKSATKKPSTDRSRARTTEPPSKKAQTGNFTAGSTAGSGKDDK